MSIRQAAFLIGGRGTRLGELTNTTPKPLIDVGGRPFLDTLIENTARFGVRDFVLLAGYLGDQVLARYQDWGRDRGLTIRCIVEPREAGTGGALQFARDDLQDEFLLCNGDSFLDINLLDLAAIETPANWIGKLALRRVPDASRYGGISRDGDRITAMAERAGPGAGLINGGVYLLRKQILAYIAAIPCSIERDIFPTLAREEKLFGREYSGYFIDIGVPNDLAQAQKDLSARLRRPAAFLDRDGILNHDHGYVHRIEDFQWCDGAIAAIKLLNDRGYYVFVVTNQAGVARGYYDEAAVNTLHAWINQDLARHGAHVDAFYFCPHHPDGNQQGYATACSCRKPEPGMLLQAMQEWRVDAAESFLVGDKQSDLDSATAAGIRSLLQAEGGLTVTALGAAGVA